MRLVELPVGDGFQLDFARSGGDRSICPSSGNRQMVALPVGHRAVFPAQDVQPRWLERMSERGLFVQLDAESGAAIAMEITAVQSHAGLDDFRNKVGSPHELLHREQRRREIEMETRRGGIRTERVVRSLLDVVCLAPASNLFGLGQATADAEIDPAIVHQVLLDQRLPIPLAGELLAGGDRRRDVLTEISKL